MGSYKRNVRRSYPSIRYIEIEGEAVEYVMYCAILFTGLYGYDNKTYQDPTIAYELQFDVIIHISL